ncbi:rhodanese-like domain-containing protein [Arcobacter acticola]|jgi:rhodanese-related sulfurtransferase|uniref:Rhodanese-like domain-containing protein n=1 Tax=Arcobacter acticola TaxID=1849015 RepID=A0A6M8EBM9_9BACT|nr:rhodanese-like domain-containing protein [Arcobacter acticola]QKE27850.1 rhodanese-like domain-containing protein [Arcobacter acticola]
MKFSKIVLSMGLLASSLFANEFINYDNLSKSLKDDAKKNGLYATTDEVKMALKEKDWAVVDVRTAEEWAGAFIKGSQRVGRQTPEVAIENFVTDDDGKLIKDKIIVVCNSAARASIEAQTFRQMGFKTVKIYDLYSWIDECNPVVTKYTVKNDRSGTGLNFGEYYAEHCKK